jgi:hypothetical protein
MLAGINGTIIAILAAIVTGYLFVHFQALEAMRTVLIEKANEVNERLYFGYAISTGHGFELAGAKDLMEVLNALVAGWTEPLSPYLGEQNPNDKLQRARLLQNVVGRATRTYPFPEMEIGAALPTPLDLDSEAKIREWFPDFETATRLLQPVLHTQRPTNELLELLKVYAAEEVQEEEEQGRVIEGAALNRQMEICDELQTFTKEALEVQRSVHAELVRIERYKKRLPSRRRLAVAAFASVLVFICGVALPMVDQSVPSVLDAWVPAIAYTAALVAAAYWIWRATE